MQARCLLKVGSWELSRAPPGQPLSPEVHAKVFASYRRVTELQADNYKAWHCWAMVNYQVVKQRPQGGGGQGAGAPQQPGGGGGSNEPFRQHAALHQHLVCAADGFIHAIALGRKKWSALVQQDLLNLLTIWFRHGALPEVHAVLSAGLERVHAVLSAGLERVELDNWLGVVPQLIARINIAHQPSRQLLHALLDRLGRRHPQALVYPLSVALLSPKEDRRVAAEALMATLQQHNGTLVRERHTGILVREALLVSRELIRVAILWHEQWHEGLEEASRLFFGAGNVQGMLDILLPLHQALEEGPATTREANFIQASCYIIISIAMYLGAQGLRAFGRDLAEAHECIRRYQRLMQEAGVPIPAAPLPGPSGGRRVSGQGGAGGQGAGGPPRYHAEAQMALNQAWDLYYAVFRKARMTMIITTNVNHKSMFGRVNKQLPQMTTLELQFVSQKLLGARSLELAVPGTYRVTGAAVRIRSFLATMQVIPSKQRPRKISMRGEDGQDYVFLLKGHEDLRQDERVMQLFGQGHEDLRQDERVMQLFEQVNALLAKDRRTNRHDLSIQRYAVAPLSHNVGVVGWVPHCDTLHALIRDYRESRRILLNIEHRLMTQSRRILLNIEHRLMTQSRRIRLNIEHRLMTQSRRTLLNIEHRLMTQAASPCEYDALTLQQKVEVFEMALEHTTGQDLYRVLWLKSQDSEAWLDRRTNYTRSGSESQDSEAWLDSRTNYTRSLAVMSMVGYILGLGDRHPSNLMLDRFTGKILHIDFGDCFEVAMQRDKFPEKIPFRLTRMLVNAMEVAMQRDKFPEKIPFRLTRMLVNAMEVAMQRDKLPEKTPFRLTRMLVNAMEVSGIEGNFRTTCARVMGVLRDNRESLMAMLEAFVHDPLISWRLLRAANTGAAVGAPAATDARAAAATDQADAATTAVAAAAAAAAPPLPLPLPPPPQQQVMQAPLTQGSSSSSSEDGGGGGGDAVAPPPAMNGAGPAAAAAAAAAATAAAAAPPMQNGRSSGDTQINPRVAAPLRRSMTAMAALPAVEETAARPRARRRRAAAAQRRSSRGVSSSSSGTDSTGGGGGAADDDSDSGSDGAVARVQQQQQQRHAQQGGAYDGGGGGGGGDLVGRAVHAGSLRHNASPPVGIRRPSGAAAIGQDEFAGPRGPPRGPSGTAQSLRRASGSSYRPNLHLEIQQLAASVTVNASAAAYYNPAEDGSGGGGDGDGGGGGGGAALPPAVEEAARSRYEHSISSGDGGGGGGGGRGDGSGAADKSTRGGGATLGDDAGGGGSGGAAGAGEALNEKALAVIRRVQEKLTGRDFASSGGGGGGGGGGGAQMLCVDEQVDRLIQQATSNENLCQLFTG
ncbi:phosphatidylinositol 3 and 4-kinase-domain-containing protein [Tribonema minus]|uniref:non-specific serine/threonine protein kinase n=1 Tax=Tribonema minus TaxID=303371 RepID=A0A835YT47_9STRA|nr:phosphatidylinositol 3 and 4-kinase-domain-containing protein [Tribonema minus]